MQRSIWVENKDWDSIKKAAKLTERTLSRYLIHLHKMNISGDYLVLDSPEELYAKIKIPNKTEKGNPKKPQPDEFFKPHHKPGKKK